MKKGSVLLLAITTILLLACSACQQSPSQMLMERQQSLPSPSVSLGKVADTEQQPPLPSSLPPVGENAESDSANTPIPPVRVQKVIEGKTVRLNIDVEVKAYPKTVYGIYGASPMVIDHEAWMEYFFPGMDAGMLRHFYDAMPDDYLEMEGLTRDTAKQVFGYTSGDDAAPEKRAHYLENKAQFIYALRDSDRLLSAEALETEADPIIQKAAETLSDEFMEFVSGDRLIRTGGGVRQIEGEESPLYVFDYSRTIEGLALLLDRPIMGGVDTPNPIEMDGAQVCVLDGEVVHASGTLRDIAIREEAAIIPLDEALTTLEIYADTIQAFSEEFAHGEAAMSEFDIRHIELMYYPVMSDDPEIAGTYAGKHGAYAVYRPVWYIASGIRLNTNFEFVMIVDAITGEVIG